MPSPLTSPAPPRTSLLAHYIAFLRNPDDQALALSLTGTVLHVWRLYTLHFLLLIPMALGIHILSQWVPSVGENDVGAAFETMPAYQFLLLAVVFAPLAEELVFRLPLRFSRLNWSLPLLLIALVLSGIAANLVPSSMLGAVMAVLMISLGVIFTALLVDRFSQRGHRFFLRHLRWFVYSSSIIFGFIHVTNYPREAWFVAPFLVLPQTTLGFLLAYVRIRLGFKWAIFTHALHNFLVSSPLLFMWMGSPNLRQQLSNPEIEVSLTLRDQLAGGLMMVWLLLLTTGVILTTVQLLKEWREAKVNTFS